MYLISETTKKRERRLSRNLLEILKQAVMAVCPGWQKCIRTILTGKENCVKSIWNLMRVTSKGKICRAENAVCTENNMMFK